jgi:hypothetical protein
VLALPALALVLVQRGARLLLLWVRGSHSP